MGLNTTDFAIIALYLAGITLFGLRFRKKQRTLRDYFLAGREIPWWAISLSIVAAETSTLTIISIPGLAYDTNLTFLQVVMGYVVGRIVISFVLLPHYFRGDLYTAYELIERRFGPGLRSLTAGLFLLTRAAAEGVRVYAVSIVVSIALGTGEVASIAIITSIDADLYVRGRAGSSHLDRRGADRDLRRWNAGRARHDSPPRSRRMERDSRGGSNGWKASGLRLQRQFLDPLYILGGRNRRRVSDDSQPRHRPAHRTAAAGCSRTEAIQTALLSSGVAILFQFALFLIVGVLLWGYYHVPSSVFGRPDRIYPTFIVTRMPHGISGLLIAAILAAAMSNLSAALNSLSSSAIMDFYARFRPQSDEKTKMRLSRLGHSDVGAGSIWLGHHCAAQSGTRRRSRIADRIDRLRRVARSLLTWHADETSQSTRRDDRHGLRLWHRVVPLVGNSRAVDVVGHDRNLHNLRGGVARQHCHAEWPKCC